MAYSFENRKRRRKSFLKSVAPFLATGLGFVSFALLVPSNASQQSEARIFTQGLSIKIDRSSPAYAALEDSLTEDTHIVTAAESLTAAAPVAPRSATLVSGTTSAAPVAERIERETRREDALLAQERAAYEDAVSRLTNAIQQRSRASSQVEPSRLPRLEVRIPSSEVAQQEPVQKKLPPIEHPTVVISFRDLGVANREELAKNFMAPIATAARSASSVSIARYNPRNPSNSRAREVSAFVDPFENAESAAQSASLVANSSLHDPDEKANENVHQLVIGGSLEFSGGIAITSANDRVVVYREEDGEQFEPGAVWIRDARFEIFVDRPVGRLVGELRSVSGEVLGRGYYDLIKLPKLAPGAYRAKGVALKIGPVPHGISGRVMSGSVAGSKSYPVANASVQLEQLPYRSLAGKDGTFAELSVLEGSSVLLKTERPGHWGTLAFAHAGQPTAVSLFTDQAMRALIKSAAPADMNSDRNSGFIWGRIKRGGAPISGARVDLMTSETQMKPIYFNALGMPDPALTASTANGLYAFFPVVPGAHAVQAADSHGLTEPSLFPVDERNVTQVDLELKITQKAKVRVFDAFKTDWPLGAEVLSAGRNRGAMVPRTGEASVTFTGGNGLLILDSDAGTTYTRTRLSLSRDQKIIDFPMVQSLWLEKMRGSLRLSPEAGTGTVVGFVRGTALYKVALDEMSLSAATRIFYFDANGNLSRNSYGESGGGFVMFNVPEGFRTVLLQPSGTTKSFATAVLVDSSVTNVLSKNLQ